MLLKGKKALILGVANERSLAWAAAQQFKAQGAELAFTYPNDAIKKRVLPLADEIGSKLTFQCDVGSDESIKNLFSELKKSWPQFDILVHSVAYANKEDLDGRFTTTTREGFRMALDISAYSLIAVTKEAMPLMNAGGSIITMTYLGATKVVQNYNVMGVAKAALEASVRYLAWDLGPQNVRVNAISAGPVKTLAAAGIRGFRSLLDSVGTMSAMKRNISADEVGKASLYLASDLSSGVTGEIHFVDCGYNTGALSIPATPQAPANS
ncbi:MAG: enoyl-ACP reductase [Oligoflexia bacterium]|nr:enoyl-ACP reductase [Oligoflexia bacterium]